MAFKAAILKRTQVVTSPKTAIGWASSYVDKTRKYKGDLKFENGIEVGKTYFTSRPPGTLSVHGFGRARVETIARTQGLLGNDAVLEYLREHCLQQKQNGRIILGLRLVLSTNPARVTELLHDQVDIDRLLVRVAEDTFNSVANRFYPGDEFCFVMGIHHNVQVGENNAWVASQKKRGVYQNKPQAPHTHAHVFLLPQTKKGLPLSMSNRTVPGRDGIQQNPLDVTLETFRENIQKQVNDLSIRLHPRMGLEWESLIREAAVSATNDFYNASRIEDLKAAIKYGLDKFCYHMRTMDRESLRKRYAARRQQYLKYAMANKEGLRLNIATALNDQITVFKGNIGRRAKLVGDLCERYKAPIISRSVKFWDLPSQKALYIAPKAKKLVTSPNRTADMLRTMRELGDMQHASQIQNLSELTEIEMKLAVLQTPAKEPEWIYGLASVAQMPELPHQVLLTAE